MRSWRTPETTSNIVPFVALQQVPLVPLKNGGKMSSSGGNKPPPPSGGGPPSSGGGPPSSGGPSPSSGLSGGGRPSSGGLPSGGRSPSSPDTSVSVSRHQASFMSFILLRKIFEGSGNFLKESSGWISRKSAGCFKKEEERGFLLTFDKKDAQWCREKRTTCFKRERGEDKCCAFGRWVRSIEYPRRRSAL